jgi:hypothetical protein
MIFDIRYSEIANICATHRRFAGNVDDGSLSQAPEWLRASFV